jgi:hypothetical protein
MDDFELGKDIAQQLNISARVAFSLRSYDGIQI